MIDPDFWRNRKVFVTGHTGFKGTWLSLWLHSLEASVTGYSQLPSTQPHLFGLCRMDELITSHIADIRNLEALSQALSDAAPDIVFHLAAQPLVRESYKNPVASYEINVMGTVYLLEAVRRATQNGIPIKAVINVSTDKCYDNRELPLGYRDSDPLGRHDPYSNSKACSEMITACYRDAYFNSKEHSSPQVALAIARAANVIGGGDWSLNRLIPDFIRSLETGEPFSIRDPQVVRPWQHVLEPLHGYLLLAQKLTEKGHLFAQGWNFGPNDEDVRSVGWVINRLCKVLGKGVVYQTEKGDQLQEAQYLKRDCSMAKQHLGWQPRWNLDTALTKIVEWIHAYEEQKDMREICLNQIREYVKGGESK